MRMNAFHNVKNPNQGNTKKVLCVCSAGLLRSPTTAQILSAPPYNYNTRAAGCNEEYALVPVTELLIHWADEIVFMDLEHYQRVDAEYPDLLKGKKWKVLDIPDMFPYRHPKLIEAILKAYGDPE